MFFTLHPEKAWCNVHSVGCKRLHYRSRSKCIASRVVPVVRRKKKKQRVGGARRVASPTSAPAFEGSRSYSHPCSRQPRLGGGLDVEWTGSTPKTRRLRWKKLQSTGAGGCTHDGRCHVPQDVQMPFGAARVVSQRARSRSE